jgi:mono/diheme cytochrome c family protein
MKRWNVVLALFASVLIFVVFNSTPRAAGAPAAGDPVKGQKIYTEQNCKMCHNPGGGKLAGDLSSIGAKRDAAWLAKYLVAPTVLDPKNPPKVKMTPVKVKGQDLDDLIAYLLTLKGK